MDVVDRWTGWRASALQHAFRLTNEAFADRLGTAVRTVAKWNANRELQPTAEIQQALDTLLYQAPKYVKARFALLVTDSAPDHAEETTSPKNDHIHQDMIAAQLQLDADPSIETTIEWLDKHTGWAPGTARSKVLSKLVTIDKSELRIRGYCRGHIGQHKIAETLSGYYAQPVDDHGVYAAHYGDGLHSLTSVLTRHNWLDLGCALNPSHDQIMLTSAAAEIDVGLDDFAADHAVRRLAEALTTKMRIVDSPLYRLLCIDVQDGKIGGSVGMATFAQYALTMDLLEGELIDALVDGVPIQHGSLPLRDRYLPDIASVLNMDSRICAGGALALCAIARPAANTRRDARDYLLLVQERSGRVLNAARRLAVIPKSFHEPLVDYRNDTQIGSTLRREMEEELFGRDDVDNTVGGQRCADPMHPSRLSEPMLWLTKNSDIEQWRMECTGFGLNLVSGNYEFASVIIIDDEEFWSRFGGHIEANWESDCLRQYSSMDCELVTELVADDAWSNEGLFALLQGLRRLTRIGGSRVNLPEIEWEIL
ncbi:MAG: transcriptional regulator [Pseudonocardiaceae bacterium]